MSTPNEPAPGYRPCLVMAHTDAVYTAEACRAFRRLGWDVYAVGAGPEARRLARLLEADLVILDVGLLEETGWLTCAKLTADRPGARVLLVTEGPSNRDHGLAEFAGAAALVDRQAGFLALVNAARRAPLSAA